MGFFQYGQVIEQVVVVATAAGTTTLVNTSKQVEVFTGSATQTIVLPNATTMSVGQFFNIYNQSTVGLSLQFNGGAPFADAFGDAFGTLAAHTSITVTLQTNGTSAGTWAVYAPPASAGNFFTQGGNAFGIPAVFGTTDNNPLEIYTNNTLAATFDTSGSFHIQSAGTDADPALTIGLDSLGHPTIGLSSGTGGTAGGQLIFDIGGYEVGEVIGVQSGPVFGWIFGNDTNLANVYIAGQFIVMNAAAAQVGTGAAAIITNGNPDGLLRLSGDGTGSQSNTQGAFIELYGHTNLSKPDQILMYSNAVVSAAATNLGVWTLGTSTNTLTHFINGSLQVEPGASSSHSYVAISNGSQDHVTLFLNQNHTGAGRTFALKTRGVSPTQVQFAFGPLSYNGDGDTGFTTYGSLDSSGVWNFGTSGGIQPYTINGQLIVNYSGVQVLKTNADTSLSIGTPGTNTSNIRLYGTSLQFNEAAIPASVNSINSGGGSRTDEVSISGGYAAAGLFAQSGSGMNFYGDLHASKPDWIEFYQGTTLVGSVLPGGIWTLNGNLTVNGYINSGKTPTVQRFTSSGTYTTPANVQYIKVKMVGAGGGGAGGGTSGSTNGGGAGTTSFGTSLLADGGGGGGAVDGVGGGGGSASVSGPAIQILAASGGGGGAAIGTNISNVACPGGMGGSSALGGAGGGGNPNSGPGFSAGANTGSGGGGGGAAGGNNSGGGGGSGGYVEAIITSPASSYSVVIASGGGGGGAGSGGGPGGAGAGGYLVVEEYYQ